MDSTHGLAVVGIGCRLPGGIDGPSAYWKALLEGRDGVRTVPEGRWDASVYYDAVSKVYRWRGENGYARKNPLEAKLVGARTFQYGALYTSDAPLPNGTRRTTIEVTESWEWHETLEVWKIDRWYKAEESFLKRVK